MSKKLPRIGLVCDSYTEFGGSVVSTNRMTHLLDGAVEMIPINLLGSRKQEDWSGRVERFDNKGRPLYQIFAADFHIDRALAPDLGEAMLNTDLRRRSWSERLAEIARAERLDAIHVYGGFIQRPLIGAYAAALLDLPLAVTFIGQDLEARIFGNHFAHIRAGVAAASLVTCKSIQAQRLIKSLLQPSGHVEIIRNSVAEAAFDPEARFEKWGDRPVIGCFAEFRRVVGLDTLINAYRLLLEKNRLLTLALGGPFRPTESTYFNGLLERLPENARVWRLGRVPHKKMLAALRMCDVVVAPSFADTSPYKVLETMLAGAPLVSTTAGGIPELVVHGEHALLVSPGDAAALADAIERMLDNPALRERCVENAGRRVREEFTREKERESYLAAYRKAGLCS